MEDKLIECPCCGSDACYQSQLEGDVTITNWLCMTCGFTTDSRMKEGSDYAEIMLTHTAELIKDHQQTHDDLVWYPTVVNSPEMGMVFPEWNKRVKDWYWAAVKAIPVLEEEKEKYPDPNNPGEYYKFRMDMSKIKRYPKNCFMDAAEEIGMFEP